MFKENQNRGRTEEINAVLGPKENKVKIYVVPKGPSQASPASRSGCNF